MGQFNSVLTERAWEGQRRDSVWLVQCALGKNLKALIITRPIGWNDHFIRLPQNIFILSIESRSPSSFESTILSYSVFVLTLHASSQLLKLVEKLPTKVRRERKFYLSLASHSGLDLVLGGKQLTQSTFSRRWKQQTVNNMQPGARFST